MLELKVSCLFISNLEPSSSNVKLLQCYGIYLTSLNLTCTKVKNTPQSCDDSAHQRTLQETLHTTSAGWGKDRGITSLYAKTQDCIIFFDPTLMMYHNLLGTMYKCTMYKLYIAPCTNELVWNQYIDLPYERMGRFAHGATFNAGGYFRTDRQVLVCGSFSVSFSSSMLNLFLTWGWSGYRRAFEFSGVFGMSSLFHY